MLATASAESVAASVPGTPAAATPRAASPQRSRPPSSPGIARHSTGAAGSDAGAGGAGGGGGGGTPGRMSTSGLGDAAASHLDRLSLGDVSSAASSAGLHGDSAMGRAPAFLGLELQLPLRADASMRRPSAGTLSLGVRLGAGWGAGRAQVGWGRAGGGSGGGGTGGGAAVGMGLAGRMRPSGLATSWHAGNTRP